MQLSEDAPTLPKLPFFVGDALLLLTAAFIASRSDAPLGAGPLLAISACVGLGAILAVIPFLVDYARRQDEALDQRQHTLASLSRETAAAAEQISIAAASLPALTQHAAQAAKLADHLPKLIQDKIHLLKEALAEASDAEIENLRQELATLRSAETEKLESTVDKIDRTAARLDELLARWEQLPAQTEAAARELQSALKSANKPHAKPAHKPAPATDEPAAKSTPHTAPKSAPEPEKTPEPPPPAIVAAPAPTADYDATGEPVTLEPVSSSAPEPKPVPEPEPEPEPAPEPDPAPVAKPAPRRKAPPPIDDNPDLFEAAPPDDEPAEPTTARSADGATRLIVTAYIGIGNKLYIRGEGPGLHPDHGVPLQFVSIGKWRWETDDATAPVKVRLYKNDQIECTALGEVTVAPGNQHEVSANFS